MLSGGGRKSFGGELIFNKVSDGFLPLKVYQSSSLFWMASKDGDFKGKKTRQNLWPFLSQLSWDRMYLTESYKIKKINSRAFDVHAR